MDARHILSTRMAGEIVISTEEWLGLLQDMVDYARVAGGRPMTGNYRRATFVYKGPAGDAIIGEVGFRTKGHVNRPYPQDPKVLALPALHDLFDLQLHAAPEFAGCEESPLHEDLSELARGRVCLDRFGELIWCNRAGSHQTLAEAVELLIGGRKNDLAAVEVDGFDVFAVLEEKKARFRRRVEQMKNVGKRERADVGVEHQFPIPGKGFGSARFQPLEQNRLGSRRQKAYGFPLLQAEARRLIGRED